MAQGVGYLIAAAGPLTFGLLHAVSQEWLLPIALLVGTGRIDGVIGVALAYAPLVLLAIRFRAGELEVRQAA